MEENNTNNHIPYQLILDEQNGALLQSDKVILENWKASLPENIGIYNQILEINENAELIGIKQKLDPEKSWQKLAQSAFREDEKININHLKVRKFQYLKWAAAAVLLIGVLITANLLSGSSIQYVHTGKNERQHLILPDGSEIIMNQNTALHYNTKDFAQNRKVKFTEGEAYFEVKHDEKNPFSIQTEALTVQDLGTSFNLNVAQKEVTVVVNSGKVAMEYNGISNRIILDTQDKGVFDKATNMLLKSKNDNVNYKSWYDKTLHYQQTPLSQVSSDLEKIYGTKIIFNNDALKERKLNAYFKDQSAEEIVQIIGTSLNLKVTKTNGDFLLTN